jgi:hypothetical protein
VANPNSAAALVKFYFRNQNGALVAQASANIPAMGSVQMPYATILGGTEASGGSLVIGSDRAVVAFALYNNRKTQAYWYAGINALVPETSGFDGEWTGSASPVLQPGQEPGDCGRTINFSINIYRSKISGSLIDPEGDVVGIEGAVSDDGSVYGFMKEDYEAVGIIDGKAAETGIDGEWFDFSGCYGTWRMQKN